jgi:REP element-mobilizing transposase RayT
MSIEVRRRIGHPKGWFHVMNRGARKVSIFADEADRTIFRSLLGRFAAKHSVKILAWCFMPNHYHLQPESEGTPLSNMMRDLDGNYARSFNERHGTKGCLFQGPFKSMLIRDREGLVYVNRYIHMNPIDIGQSPEGYRWSSCNAYLGLAPVPSWMDLEPVQQCLRKPERSDAESYAFYLEERRSRPRKIRKRPDPVGDFYTEWIRHLEEKCIERLVGCEDSLGRVTTTTVVTWLAHRVYGVPAEVIAAFFGYGSPATVRAVTGRVQQRIVQDPAFREAIQSVTIPATQKR